MKIVGIDYGHGETSAGYVDSETVYGNEIYLKDLQITAEEYVIPSVICKMTTNEFVINPTDNQLASAKEIGIYFKAPLIGNEQYEEITPENKSYFKTFIQQVYNSIASNENNPLHVDPQGNIDYKVYIACPSGWNEAQMHAYKAFVQNECNVPLVDIVKESRAAYIASRRKVGEGIRTQGGNVLVIDFGSSTVDFTYFNNDTKFKPIHEGYPYGASHIENAVLDYMVAPQNKNVYDNYKLVIERCGKSRGRNALLFEIRRAKEMFFSQDDPQLFNPYIHLRELFLDRQLTGHYIEPSFEYEKGYPREILENVILKDYMQDLENMLDDFASKENVSKIDKVILTGGASRMYFFKRMVSEKYGVSKKDHTLIVDLEPSVTISEGIAAFGYMNEMSNLAEKKLKEATENWIKNNLPSLLKSTIEKRIGDLYYNEFTAITSRYSSGSIAKDGKHNLDGLEDEFISLLNRWSASGDVMSAQIVAAVQTSIIYTLGKTLANFAQTWGYKDATTEDFEISIHLDINASLTSDSCQSLLKYIWANVINYINNRDFWGWDDNSSPFKERNYNDRSGISNHLNNKLRSYFNDLNYESSLDEEVAGIAENVREKVQDFIDDAKLQQYR